MKFRFGLFLIVISLSPFLFGQQYWPGETWEKWKDPGKEGWDEAKLSVAKQLWKSLQEGSNTLIVWNGKIVASWGDIKTQNNMHSVRKSFVSELYGSLVDSDKLKLTDTMKSLGINDKPPRLSDLELSSTVHDVIRARSGVYHCSAYTVELMIELQPPRDSVQPGHFWYYNNWDFNVAGDIVQIVEQRPIFEVFRTEVAQPIQMQDFCTQQNPYYKNIPEFFQCASQFTFDECSEYPAYLFYVSARDSARFGLMMARGGKWKNKQIIPETWVNDSTRAHTSIDSSFPDCDDDPTNVPCYSEGLDVSMPVFALTPFFDGYSYLWWTSDKTWNALRGKRLYSAIGGNGNFIAVVPELDLVMVVQEGGSYQPILTMMDVILQAYPWKKS